MDDGHDGDAAPSTPSIEQAKGILMARHGIGPAAAATRLRTAARYARRPLGEIAEDLIADLLRRGRPPVPPLSSAPAEGGRRRSVCAPPDPEHHAVPDPAPARRRSVLLRWERRD